MEAKPVKKTESIAGTYVYDKKLKKVVKVSSCIPKVASKSRAGAGDFPTSAGPCGRTECGGGSCAMNN